MTNTLSLKPLTEAVKQLEEESDKAISLAELSIVSEKAKALQYLYQSEHKNRKFKNTSV